MVGQSPFLMEEGVEHLVPGLEEEVEHLVPDLEEVVVEHQNFLFLVEVVEALMNFEVFVGLVVAEMESALLVVVVEAQTVLQKREVKVYYWQVVHLVLIHLVLLVMASLHLALMVETGPTHWEVEEVALNR